MQLRPGGRLGAFEVLSHLGAGGMGEVYRGRDTRLGREVAIKVLPAEVSADPGRLKRFENEASTASSLNHPSIVTVYEVGREGDISYIAMELVEGETLRELISEGPLPMKRVVAIAAQIADGLARAHDAGIVHRDLKLENIMIRRDGFAKILDFGLAKLTQPDVSGVDRTKSPTLSAGTGAGVVMGTVGYMSPEQALGEAVDFRSDQFSFGAIVYEMATGRRAFNRTSAPEILSAIIRDEPEPLATLSPLTPVPLRWIVERCLAKSPEERYASTEDLARDLATVRDHISEAMVSRPVASASATTRRRYAAFAITAALALAGGLFFGQRLGRTPLPNFRRITFRRGLVGYGRFAPDGQTIVYSAAWEGRDQELFLQRIESPESRSLGLPSANILSISSSGEMAILLFKPFDPGAQTLARLPMSGGAPRELLTGVQEADWSPDGKSLAVAVWSANGSGKKRIEYPIGKVLYESKDMIARLRVSPKGDLISFTERPSPLSPTSVVLLDTTGKTRILQGVRGFSSLAWSPAGDELWLAIHSGSETEFRAVTLSGRQRPLFRLPGWFNILDVSRDGRMLAEQLSNRFEILFSRSGETTARSISWLDSSFAAALSRDGKTLLIDERLHGDVYLRKTDGSPAIRLGEGEPLALSPDGRWALVRRGENPVRLVLLPTGAGDARELETGPFERVRAGAFLPDGKRIVFEAGEPGKRSAVFVQDVASGPPRLVTPEPVEMPEAVVSPDGKLVAARGETGWGLYPIDGGAPRPISGCALTDLPVQWSADGRFLFVQGPEEFPAPVSRLEIASGRKVAWREFQPMDPAGVEMSIVRITPDGSAWAYSYYHEQSDLFLVERLARR